MLADQAATITAIGVVVTPILLAIIAAFVAHAKAKMDADNARTEAKVDGVHTLVNAEKTAAISRERDDKALALAQMEELIELRKDSGKKPSENTLAVYAALNAKLVALDADLAERARQTAIAEAQMAAGKTPAPTS